MPRPAILLVSFDTPFPVNYGGIYDIVARARFLQRVGFNIDLLCCYSDEGRLNALLEKQSQDSTPLFRRVFPLRTRFRLHHLFHCIPASAALRDPAVADDVVATLREARYQFALIEHLKLFPLAVRLKSLLEIDLRLRMQNDEYQYYSSLARSASPGPRRLFLQLEAARYRSYQPRALSSAIFSSVYFISPSELSTLGPLVSGRAMLLPVYFSLTASGKTAETLPRTIAQDIDFLYVGNLNLDENLSSVRAALEYLRRTQLPSVRIVICGRCDDLDRGRQIVKILNRILACDVCLNVSAEILADTYSNSKMFLNFSLNPGGVKTKLIEALSHRLLVLTNELGVAGSGLDACCLNTATLTSQELRRLLDDSYYLAETRAQLLSRLDDAAALVEEQHRLAFL